MSITKSPKPEKESVIDAHDIFESLREESEFTGLPISEYVKYSKRDWVMSQRGILIPDKRSLKNHRQKILAEAEKEYCVSTGDLDFFPDDRELWGALLGKKGRIMVMAYDLMPEMNILKTVKNAHEMGANVRRGHGPKVRASVTDYGKEAHIVFKYLGDKTKRVPGKPQAYGEGLWIGWVLKPPESERFYESFVYTFNGLPPFEDITTERKDLRNYFEKIKNIKLL